MNFWGAPENVGISASFSSGILISGVVQSVSVPCIKCSYNYTCILTRVHCIHVSTCTFKTYNYIIHVYNVYVGASMYIKCA